MKAKWKRIYKNRTICYEGFAIQKHPYGAGTEYYANGVKHYEGVFGFKGLRCGREYYPNGKIRFEGVYHENRKWGPNIPSAGRFYSENEKLLFEGKFEIKKSGNLAWPSVAVPKEFGSITKYKTDHSPDYFLEMPLPLWKRINYKIRCFPETLRLKCFLFGRKLKKLPAVTLNEYTEFVRKCYFYNPKAMAQWQVDYFDSEEAQKHIKQQYKYDINRFNNGEIGYASLTNGCPSSVAYCLEWMAE